MNNQIKVLVAPNSFKECADSVELVTLFENGFDKHLPKNIKSKIKFDYKPISDGGDGFLEVCKYHLGLEKLHFEISYPYSEEKFLCPVGYWESKKILFIESAEVLGLKKIPEDQRKPMELSSKGMGELLIQILDGIDNGLLDVEHVIIGIGGTGTNDLGLGMMEVFGLELYDKNDNKLDVLPKNFELVEKIVVPEVNFPFKLETIIDVENPLLGEKGACKSFAHQKGATEFDIVHLEKGFENILHELELEKEFIAKLSGAGGGLAAAFKIFFNAEEKFASDFIEKYLEIKLENSDYNLIITGEGKFDFQSFMNKGSMIIANKFAQKNIPVYIVCGEAEGILPDDENIHLIELAEYFDSTEESIANIDKGIDIACKQISKFLLKQIEAN